MEAEKEEERRQEGSKGRYRYMRKDGGLAGGGPPHVTAMVNLPTAS